MVKNKKRQFQKRVLKTKNPPPPKPIKLDFDPDWVYRHMEAVRPQIEELDRQTMESIAMAPFIAVSNATKK